MKKYGYIKLNHSEHEMSAAWEQLKSYGCDQIVTDKIEDNMVRPNLLDLLKKMKSGDTLVLYRFSNAVRGVSQLTFLLKSCGTRQIRIVATDDKLDTKDEVGKLWQIMIANFPSDARSGERAQRAVNTANNKFGTTKFGSKSIRDHWVIDNYLDNMPISQICDRACIGRTTLFRILQDNKVDTQRRGRGKMDRLDFDGVDADT